MTDPLSITLAVFSLATALKDIIELAQTLNDSFKKPGQNMRRAESLASETLEIVQDLKKFYDAHTEILDSAPDMRDAILRLSKEMERVHEKCKPMLQLYATSDRNLHTLIRQKVVPWWKQNSLEEAIRNLRDGANKCQSDFMMFALLRIEAMTSQVQAATAQTQATAVQIQATTIEIRAAVTHELARPRVQPPHLQAADDNLLAFMGSTPVILSQLPAHVKLAEHLVYKEAITFQVGKIEILFKMIASGGCYPIEEPDHLHLQPFSPVARLHPSTKEEIEELQSDVFAQIAKIREKVKGRHNGQLAIQDGARAMSDLSVQLSSLDMYHESLALLRYAVDLYRILTRTNKDVYGPHLANALYLMSYTLVHTGELVQAYGVVTKAVIIGRWLVTANPTFEAQMQLADLVCYSSYVARQNGDLKNAIRDAEEAVQTYERLFGQPTSVLQMEVNIIDNIYGPTVMTLAATHVGQFAQALMRLHHSLSSTSRKYESVSAGIKALELYSALEQRGEHTDISRFIADLCYSLASDDNRDVVTFDQALSYAQTAVFQYEKVLKHTGNVPRDLPFSLARQAKILSNLDRVEEAYVVCQKLKQIIHKHVEDHHLRAESLLQLTQNLFHSRRFLEAAQAGEQLVATCRVSLLNGSFYTAYSYTSWAFEHAGNTFKAVQIAESALSYWRVLASHDSINVPFLAASVDNLTRRLLSAAEYGRAFSAGHEAMKLYGSLIRKDPIFLQNYMNTLQLNMDIAIQAEIQSLERSKEVIHYSRALVEQFPDQQMFLIGLIPDHARLLEDYDQFTEASAAIDEVLLWFGV